MTFIPNKTRFDSIVPFAFPDRHGNPKDPRTETRLFTISHLENDKFPTSLGIPIPAPPYPRPFTVEFSILRFSIVLDPDAEGE
jgi:hypothetical protein